MNEIEGSIMTVRSLIDIIVDYAIQYPIIGDIQMLLAFEPGGLKHDNVLSDSYGHWYFIGDDNSYLEVSAVHCYFWLLC
jgi:hypothetical protein